MRIVEVGERGRVYGVPIYTSKRPRTASHLPNMVETGESG